MNNYIIMSYRDVIVIAKFAITKFATRRASKAQSIMHRKCARNYSYQCKNLCISYTIFQHQKEALQL